MESRSPTIQEMQALVAYLPRLYADGFEPVIEWHGGKAYDDGLYRLPYPEYHPLVHEFFGQVASGGWLDYGYNPESAARMLSDPEFVKSASIPEIQSMLTYCVRGERFSDGHWAEMIENGNIRRLLERVEQLMGNA